MAHEKGTVKKDAETSVRKTDAGFLRNGEGQPFAKVLDKFRRAQARTRARTRKATQGATVYPDVIYAPDGSTYQRVATSQRDTGSSEERETEAVMEELAGSLADLDERMGAFNERMKKRLAETEHLFNAHD